MGIIDLWAPILVSAATCFVMSAVIWTVFKYHNSDYTRFDDEDGVRGAVKGTKPGYYMLPYCLDPADMKKPEVKQKYVDGPLAYVTVLPNGIPSMGPKFIGMILYFLAVGVLCAYFVTRTLAPDADYLAVFRVAGTVAFVANGFGVIPESVWFGRPWSMTIKTMIDALIYGLLTGGVFGWLV